MSSLFERLTGLELLDPWLLALALLLLPALLPWRREATVRFAPGELAARETPASWRLWLLPAPRVLTVLGLLLVVVALARPVACERLPHDIEGIDIVLCLDVSSSMTATDMDPRRSRMEVAQEAASRFVAGRPNDRIGLISFARYPDLLCPPTLDHVALTTILAATSAVESDGPEDATGIGTALAKAAQVLSGGTANSRVVILLTDGEENVATAQTPDEIAPLHAARLCEELGVRVYTIAAGIGRRDRSGTWVALDHSQIQRVAESTGGEFFPARDAGAVAAVYYYIDGLEKVELDEPPVRIKERFLPFLIAAVALLLLARLLESTVLEVAP